MRSAATARRVTAVRLVGEQRHAQGIFMHKPSLTPSARLRLIRAIGCLAYPVGLGVVIGLALFIKSML